MIVEVLVEFANIESAATAMEKVGTVGEPFSKDMLYKIFLKSSGGVKNLNCLCTVL
jgi:hypothetical protein